VTRLYGNNHFPCNLSLPQQKFSLPHQYSVIDRSNLNLVKNNNLHVSHVLLNYAGRCQELGWTLVESTWLQCRDISNMKLLKVVSTTGQTNIEIIYIYIYDHALWVVRWQIISITLSKDQPSVVVVLQTTHSKSPMFLPLLTLHLTSCPIRLKSATHSSSSVSPSVPLIFTNCDPVVPSYIPPVIDTVIVYSVVIRSRLFKKFREKVLIRILKW
jgi:hypothetical protein